MDGYARGDVLQEIYHYDNSAFLRELTNKGFYIADESQSNYMQTPLSLGSSLNMSYISGIPKLMPDRGYLMGMIQNSRTWSIFRQLGYKLVAFDSGYQVTEMKNADNYYTSPKIEKSSDLEGLLLNNSALIILIEQNWIKIPINHYYSAQERINYTFTTLANEIPLIKGPKFIFAHIIAPHPPFIFNQFGPIKPNNFYFLIDAGAFTEGQEVYIHEYIDQLIYINKQIIDTIDSIIKYSKIPPIIILQSDHGPGAYLNYQSVENSCLMERFSILNAYYIPEDLNIELKKDISPVNTFSVIFNSLLRINIKLLDNKEYFSSWFTPYNFIDVTEKSMVSCNHP